MFNGLIRIIEKVHAALLGIGAIAFLSTFGVWWFVYPSISGRTIYVIAVSIVLFVALMRLTFSFVTVHHIWRGHGGSTFLNNISHDWYECCYGKALNIRHIMVRTPFVRCKPERVLIGLKVAIDMHAKHINIENKIKELERLARQIDSAEQEISPQTLANITQEVVQRMDDYEPDDTLFDDDKKLVEILVDYTINDIKKQLPDTKQALVDL